MHKDFPGQPSTTNKGHNDDLNLNLNFSVNKMIG